jgi:hypothetical protein
MGQLVRSLLCVILATATSPGAVQGQARPGDGTRLRAGIDSLFIYTINGNDTAATGRVRDELSVIKEGTEERLLRVYASTDAILGSRLDTIVDRRADLVPRYHHSQTSSGSELVRFTGRAAVGYARLASGDSVGIRAALPEGTINGSSFDLFLRSSDLRIGKRVSVTAFEANSRSLVPLDAKVTGEDVVSGEPCWRAEAAFGGTAVHFWIGKTSKRLHQQLMFIRPDFQILFRSTPHVQKRPGRRAA